MDLTKQIYWKVIKESCPEDPEYKYHVIYKVGKKTIYDDWWIDKPNEKQIYNTILSAEEEGLIST